jgi:DNA polymerase I
MVIGCTMDEAQEIINAYFLVYPRIKQFIDDAHEKARLNKWVFSVFGQRKMQYGLLPMYQRSPVYNASLRNAQNNLIQGPASTLGLIAFTYFSERIKELGGFATCTVYDSIELEVPIENLSKAIEMGYQCLDDYPVERFDWLDFKIGCDCEIGYNWGQLRKAYRGVAQEECLSILAASTSVH